MALLAAEKQAVPDSFPLGNGTSCRSSEPVEVDGGGKVLKGTQGLSFQCGHSTVPASCLQCHRPALLSISLLVEEALCVCKALNWTVRGEEMFLHP